MSETGQEKTEEATPRKKEEASERGQVAYSKELTGALLFLGIVGLLFLFGAGISHQLQLVMLSDLGLEGHSLVTNDSLGALADQHIEILLSVLLPVVGAVLLITLLGGLLQTGFSLSLKRVAPRPDKIDPIKGFGKLFSAKSAMTVLASALKVVIVAIVAYTVIDKVLPVSRVLVGAPVEALIALFPKTVFEIGFKVGALLLLLAVADVVWQRYSHAKQLKMTKQEVRDDSKHTEGDPQVKSRVRQLQRERARARMMNDVKDSTVVVRNPTHFAVALRYEPGKDPAPRVMAKGRGFMALRIIELAEKADVPIRSDPPLARQLYPIVQVGRVVPEDLFQAVAKLLTWVYRSRGKGPESLHQGMHGGDVR